MNGATVHDFAPGSCCPQLTACMGSPCKYAPCRTPNSSTRPSRDIAPLITHRRETQSASIGWADGDSISLSLDPARSSLVSPDADLAHGVTSLRPGTRHASIPLACRMRSGLLWSPLTTPLRTTSSKAALACHLERRCASPESSSASLEFCVRRVK